YQLIILLKQHPFPTRRSSDLQVTRLLDPANPNVLTIGFARRFATYKRAALLLRDRERLLKLVTNEDRPVLFLFAGKAHPADHPRSEEHTSDLQSRENLVCRLL